jgi:gliding motility-associated-like protein
MYNVNNIMGSLHLNADPEYDTLPTNKIDSIWVRGFVEYTNRCLSSDSVLIRVYPIFDTFDVAGICAGERYYWPHTQQYYTQTTTEPVFDTLSEPGCDSTVHLHLTDYDVSHTYDTIDTCAPLLWQDSILHDHTNTSTISIDTVIKKNIAECDSIVHLVLTIYPVEAHIRSSLQYFDFDNLDVKLDDISTGNASRTWQFPSGPDQTGAEAFWTMPTELDSADIRLIAHSQYGCNDTAHIVIPMNKENVWIPNAFMPDDPQGNNIFSTVSKGTVKQEMYIYNRRGQLVFHCEGTDCGWDGRDGNGDLFPQGAYVYLIRYVNKLNPEKTQVRKGTVTSIR